MVLRDEFEDAEREEATDALIDGDIPLRRGTAGAALRHRDFSIVWGGTLLSNIGTWMQNVLLGAYGYTLTGSAAYVGVLFFAQLGPLLFLSTVGGALADTVDRRRLLVGMQLVQLAFSVVLAGLVSVDRPSEALLVACVFAIGVANALSAPGLSAILPRLVPREDLPGAVSLQSVQMNLSRVVGPAIGALIYSQVGAAPVFLINAATYGFAIAALLIAHYPRRAGGEILERGLARLASGFRIAAADPLLAQVLITLATFSFFSLTFVGLMPAVAEQSLGIAAKSVAYGVLYAVFGLGAALGAVSVGTVFAPVPKERLVRPGFVAFAGLLPLFALLRAAPPAYPTVLLLGYAYFVVITSLSTVLQSHVDDHARGRVMALWIMGFGGTVPLGVLAGGWLEELTSITFVLLAGAAVALVLAAVSRPDRLRP